MRRILVALACAGCVKSSAVPCGDGLVCGEGLECRTIGDRHLCVGSQELDACLELPEGGACSVGGVAGSCRDGVCVAAVCGDGAVDPGEACDDGNGAIGDGCSVECLSNETCGNGFTDSLRREGMMLVANEQCDDANRGAHDGCSSSCRNEAPLWLRSGQVKPTLGADAAMVWDAARERLVMFGGRAGNDTADLLEWDGAAWIERTAIAAPPPRSRHAMTYDAAHHRVVVFGGAGGSAKLGDTWAWDGSVWRLVSGADAPSARDEVRMAYDGKRKKVVLFGGVAPATTSGPSMGASLGDTWQLDGDTWTRVCATCAPPPRYGHMMAFDPRRGRVVMYGGFDASGVAKGDVWEFDGNWHDVTPAATGGPLPRGYAAMVFDPTLGKVVVVGGQTTGVPLLDAWAWDGQSWSAAPTLPFAFERHALGFDAARGRLVLATWNQSRVFELVGTMWRQVTPGDAPSGRIDAAIATDDAHRTSFVFGGSAATAPLDDTWSFDGERWTAIAIATRPPARSQHAMAYDRAAERVVLYGGELAGGGFAGDSWTFDASMMKWTSQTAATGRKGHRMAWDGQRVIAFGGSTPAGRTADTLAWTGSAWMPLTPAMSPPERSDAAMAFDPLRRRVVLFGGILGGTNTLGTAANDTWEWDGTTWTRVATPTTPPARERATLAWDPARRRLVLFGGRSGATAYDDAWELDGSTWSPLALQLRPPARSGHLALSGAEGIIVLSGETAKVTDHWRLRWDSFAMDEVCRADLDLDGDGLRGCADLDCWALCQPLCPPGTDSSCMATTAHCGDGTCGAVESCRSCPEDCGACTASCGDFACDVPESAAACPGDC